LTVVPAQTLFADSEMEMLTGRFGFTVIANALDKAGFPAGQVISEVNLQVITSPFSGVKLKTGPFNPAAFPLTIH
jgi:hypothetical protein